jgi:hypothetical protein
MRDALDEPYLPPPRETPQARLHRLERFARLMDSQFRIPGTQIRLGLDGLIGLIPGVGDAAAAALASYVFAEALALKVSKRTIVRMLINSGVDLMFGVIPVVGDLFDIGFKSNAMNARLVLADVERRRLKAVRRAV